MQNFHLKQSENYSQSPSSDQPYNINDFMRLKKSNSGLGLEKEKRVDILQTDVFNKEGDTIKEIEEDDVSLDKNSTNPKAKDTRYQDKEYSITQDSQRKLMKN